MTDPLGMPDAFAAASPYLAIAPIFDFLKTLV